MLNIFNIQHFSVGDGDGIRTTVFFKGCNLHCPWCHNPESLSFSPVILHDKKRNTEEVSGRQATAEEVLCEILEDRDYYAESGGGVTFSGGEVLLQATAAAELAKRLKEEQISVFVDTAGCVPYQAFKTLNAYVDTYLFDVKTASARQYKDVIGGDLPLVTENLRRLLSEQIDVRIRIPLIPDFNTDPSSVEALCHLLTEIGVTAVDLLLFHRMGSGKYEALGLDYRYKDVPPMEKKQIEPIRKQYETYFRVRVE